VFRLDGRNRRPPRDPINALLSFAYSLLAKDFATDPQRGRARPIARILSPAAIRTPGARTRHDGGISTLVADSVVNRSSEQRCRPRRRVSCVHTPASPSKPGSQTADPRLRTPHGPTRDPPRVRVPNQLSPVLEVQARLLGRVLLAKSRNIRASALATRTKGCPMRQTHIVSYDISDPNVCARWFPAIARVWRSSPAFGVSVRAEPPASSLSCAPASRNHPLRRGSVMFVMSDRSTDGQHVPSARSVALHVPPNGTRSSHDVHEPIALVALRSYDRAVRLRSVLPVPSRRRESVP